MSALPFGQLREEGFDNRVVVGVRLPLIERHGIKLQLGTMASADISK